MNGWRWLTYQVTQDDEYHRMYPHAYLTRQDQNSTPTRRGFKTESFHYHAGQNNYMINSQNVMSFNEIGIIMSVYVYVYVYVYTCTRVYVYTCIRVYVHTCIRVYVYTCTCVHVYMCTCVHVYVCVCMCMYVFTCVCD